MIPKRPVDEADTDSRPYRYHMWDYAHSQAFTQSPAQGLRSNNSRVFYSLEKDLAALATEAQAKEIPVGLQTIGNSAQNLDIRALRLGENDTKKVLFTGGVHGREWIGTEFVYLIAEYLIKNYSADPQTDKQKRLNRLLDRREIWFVPLVNPDGQLHSVYNQRDWRMNRHALCHAWGDFPNPPFVPSGGNQLTYQAPQYEYLYRLRHPRGRAINVENNRVYIGVDVNRNFYSPNWGQECYANDGARSTSCDPAQEKQTYCGPRPNSESETRSIVDLWANHGPFLTTADYHSYFRAVLYVQDAQHNPEVRLMMDCFRNLIQNRLLGTDQYTLRNRTVDKNYWQGPHATAEHYDVGSVKDTVEYDAFNSVTDYTWAQGARPAFTIELDPPKNNRAGFDLPDTDIQAVFEKNIRSALALIYCAGKPRYRNEPYLVRVGRTIGSAFKTRIGCCETFKNWDVYAKGNELP